MQPHRLLTGAFSDTTTALSHEWPNFLQKILQILKAPIMSSLAIERTQHL